MRRLGIEVQHRHADIRNAVAIAGPGRNGEIRYLGEIDNAEAALKHGAAANQPEAMTSLGVVHEHLQKFAEAKYRCEKTATLRLRRSKRATAKTTRTASICF